MRGSTAFLSKASGVKKRDSLSNVEKTWAVSAALLRSRVNIVKLRSVSVFTFTLRPSYEHCLTRQAEKFAE